MKKIIMLLCVIFVAGCDSYPVSGSKNDAKTLVRFEDKENGVVCYQVFGGSAPLSCVKVSDGVKS